jgi:hypothetical protein
MMDGAKTVTATWRTDSTLLYATIAAVIVAIALVAGCIYFKIAKLSHDIGKQASNGKPQTTIASKRTMWNDGLT